MERASENRKEYSTNIDGITSAAYMISIDKVDKKTSCQVSLIFMNYFNKYFYKLSLIAYKDLMQLCSKYNYLY